MLYLIPFVIVSIEVPVLFSSKGFSYWRGLGIVTVVWLLQMVRLELAFVWHCAPNYKPLLAACGVGLANFRFQSEHVSVGSVRGNKHFFLGFRTYVCFCFRFSTKVMNASTTLCIDARRRGREDFFRVGARAILLDVVPPVRVMLSAQGGSNVIFISCKKARFLLACGINAAAGAAVQMERNSCARVQGALGSISVFRFRES